MCNLNEPVRFQPLPAPPPPVGPWLAWIGRFPVTAFFALSCLLLWVFLTPYALAKHGWLPPVFQLMGFPGKFAPSLATIIVASLVLGPEATRAMLARIFDWRVRPRWWIGCLLGPPILLLVALLADARLRGDFPTPDLAASGLFLPLLVRYVLFGGGLGEEIGWRGFALPMLQRRHGALAASVVIGLVWSGWHLPELALEPTIDKLLGFIPFTIALTAGSVIFKWVYNGTGGALSLVILLHGAVNAASAMLDRVFEFQGDDFRAQMIFAGLVVAVAFGVVVRYGPRHLSRRTDGLTQV